MTAFIAGQRVAILLPLPLFGPFDYLVGDGQTLSVGDFVRVPLNKRDVIGVVWEGISNPDDDIKCRPVNEVLPIPPLPQISRQFVDWVAAYCLAPQGAVLKMVLSVPAALDPVKPPRSCLVATDRQLPPAKLTDIRRRVLAAAQTPRTAAALAEAAGVGVGVIRSLVALGALTEVAGSPPAAPLPPDHRHPGPTLSPGQALAAGQLRDRIGAGFSVSLLQGVTGSGKTEVYFEAIAATLARGEQALILLPEIALTAQLLERFTERFGVAPQPWHSELTDAQRRNSWRAVATGQASVVVGARSALFLPFTRLGLIVVDEEHDGSFKQEEGVCYHARDMAVVRAQLAGLPIILASATPSLESLNNVATGRYQLVSLPDRHGGARLPTITLIDLRRDPPPRQRFIAPPLQQAVESCLAAGEQALLFLNRRGYAPLTLCGACGHRLQCPHCTAWLVDHRGQRRLQCHHCGYLSLRPEACPNCQAENRFTPCGPGVERIAEEAALLFPQARIAVMASDLLVGPGAAAKLVEQMAKREIDILIGTQIVAKGHHFPLLTLVGVIDADLGLNGGDLRAAERTFQLLSQVSGRAGRAAHEGQVMLQSYQPDAPVIQALAAGDVEGFIATEIEDRRSGLWPPFGRLAALIVSAPESDMADQACAALSRQVPEDKKIDVLGPAPAPLALLRGRHRRRFLLKSGKQVNLQAYIRHWLGSVKLPYQVRVQVDIDPYNFL